MGPLLLCIVSVLLPQEPVPNPPPIAVAAPAAQQAAVTPADERRALAALESSGEAADAAELARLAGVADDAVAHRAAWLLAQRQDRPARTALATVAATSPHGEARLHALAALLRWREPSSTAAGIACLEHQDRRVRTLAAQLLGELRRPGAIEPLSAMLDRARTGVEPGAATDLAAALVALADLQAADALLRAALAVHDSKAEGTGAALAYCCQQLVPKLAEQHRRTFLLTAIAHREPLVRRYALGAVAESGDPAAATALEGRLGSEGDELRPLVELALQRVRPDPAARPEGELTRAANNLKALGAMVAPAWRRMGLLAQGLAIGLPCLGVVAWLWLRARRRRAQAEAEAQALLDAVQPSAEFLAETGAETPDPATAADGSDPAPAEVDDAAAETAGQYEHAGSNR